MDQDGVCFGVVTASTRGFRLRRVFHLPSIPLRQHLTLRPVIAVMLPRHGAVATVPGMRLPGIDAARVQVTTAAIEAGNEGAAHGSPYNAKRLLA
jgi:hypothetical protein